MSRVEQYLRDHEFFKDLENGYLKAISACATAVGFDEGEYVLRAGAGASAFYIITEGDVEIQHQSRILTVLKPGDVLGWSWLFPPYTWHFDARAKSLVRAIVLDGQCVRDRCENDHTFGYKIVSLFSEIAINRLEKALKLPPY